MSDESHELALKLPGNRYMVSPAGDWYVVVDSSTGRELTPLTDWNAASKFSDRLNTAAYCGREALNRALGASAELK